MTGTRHVLASLAAGTVAVAAGLVLTGPRAAAAPAFDVPTVSVTVAPVQHESLLGGACYRGNVEVDQPPGFVITRTGPVDDPLEVTYGGQSAHTDMMLHVTPGKVTIPAGSASLAVARAYASEPSISYASWSGGLEDGPGYVVGARSASFEGLIPANPDTMGTCNIRDDNVRLDLHVGEEVPPGDFESKVRDFTLADGKLPAGMRVDDTFGLDGAPAAAGTFKVTVSECPWPNVGDRICGRLRYTIQVVPDGPDHGDTLVPADSSSSSTSTIDIDRTGTGSDDHGSDGKVELNSASSSGSGAARAAGVSAVVVGLGGLALVIRRAHAGSD